MNITELETLRRDIRAQRRAIDPETRAKQSEQAAEQILNWLMTHPEIKRVATFSSLPEEIDTAPLNRALWQRGYQLYLPYVAEKDQSLLWLSYNENTILAPDQAGILAPKITPPETGSGRADSDDESSAETESASIFNVEEEGADVQNGDCNFDEPNDLLAHERFFLELLESLEHGFNDHDMFWYKFLFMILLRRLDYPDLRSELFSFSRFQSETLHEDDYFLMTNVKTRRYFYERHKNGAKISKHFSFSHFDFASSFSRKRKTKKDRCILINPITHRYFFKFNNKIPPKGSERLKKAFLELLGSKSADVDDPENENQGSGRADFITKKTPQTISATKLDLVIMPLVAFDQSGTRLGMGGGFYDRSFQGKMQNELPWLVGIAYPCQQVAHLPRRAWDVPLNAIATGEQFLTFDFST